MKDKKLRAMIFGESAEMNGKMGSRSQTINIPGLNGERYRSYTWGRDDGIFIVLIRMIEELEKRIDELERPKKK